MAERRRNIGPDGRVVFDEPTPAFDRFGESGFMSETGAVISDQLQVVDTNTGAPVLEFRGGEAPITEELPTAPLGTALISTNLSLNGGYIQSSDYEAGSAGWNIGYNGDAEFNNVTVRGVLTAQDSTTTLTPNGTFEVNTTGWSGTTLTRITSDFASGVACMKSVSAGAAAYNSVTTPTGTSGIPVLPDTTYRLSAALKAVTANRNAFLTVNYYTAAGAFVSGYDGYPVQVGTAGWQTLMVSGVSPATAAFATVVVQWESTAGSQEFRIDDVVFVRASTVVAQSLTTASITGGPKATIATDSTYNAYVKLETGDVRDTTPGVVYALPGALILTGPNSGGTAATVVLQGGSTPQAELSGDLTTDGGTSYATKPTAYAGVLTASSADPNLGATGTSACYYTRLGNVVHCWGVFTWGGSGVSGGSGTYRFPIPFTADGTYTPSAGGAPLGGWLGIDSSASIRKAGYAVINSTTRAVGYQSVDNVLTTDTLLSHNSIVAFGGAGDTLSFDFTYICA